MGDTESCSSRAADFSLTQNRQHKQKVHTYNEVLHRLMDLNVAESTIPGFEDELWAHFYRLPAGYALDVNAERAQDVLMHKKLLQLAHDPATRPAFEVRPVLVHLASDLGAQRIVETPWSYARKQSIQPQQAFDLSPDLRLAFEANQFSIQKLDHTMNSRPMHEITISTNDKPKLFCQLTSLLSEVGLNIQEAHAFSTIDGYSLDVFLVDGWALEETEQLKVTLAKKIPRIEHPRLNQFISPAGQPETGMKLIFNHAEICNDGSEVRDLDLRLLKFEKKIATGSYSDLKVQHKNVVKFIGASTKPPSLCIITEFMSGGSLYDFLKQSGVLPLQFLLRVAIDVSNGMNYLHQNNIIHRDLKAANLLMDENGVVKVSDFGVARVQPESGVMTAETGTYRWMAPEVIEHRPYDQKADVFSFGIMLWELLTGKLPYENLTPLQAAVGVVHKGLRPTIHEHTDPILVELMESCWQKEPSLRPPFSEILEILQCISNRISDPRVCKQKEKASPIIPAFMHGRGPSTK
ncbi:serine/threonine-protein kinase STY46 isoform X3 [Cannabis sativa]|uniref:serine/threonine-protein kinase STY46 isoform X3 n=1 Tax=Cannabis sativa TaxID=3483 RepID=UPI0029CA6A69|nr:serine/threonine-protein kinase STY46 isoform X3 [Cannabis sativa]